jgi:hypothetical protein
MKTNIDKIVIVVAFIGISIVCNAQNRELGGPQKDRIEAFKIAFFTRQMQLTPEEAQLFWPLYNHYQESLDIQKKDRRKSLRDANEFLDEMSDDEINDLIDNRLKQAELALKERKEFVGQLRKVLPVKKVAQYFRAEELFKKKLMDKMNERKQYPPHSVPGEN